jgi:hypothetical protein
LQVWPVVVQSLHVPPRLPQVELLACMQVPPWQQPLRHVRRLQVPPLPPLDDVDDPLDELLPLLLPLLEDVEPPHVPVWHDCPVTVQSVHDAPFNPHADSSLPRLQLPDESQHPPQTAAHPPPSSPPSGVLASSVVASSPPVVAPELPPAPLLLRPTPLLSPEPLLDPLDDVALPASCVGVGVGVTLFV